MSHGHGSGILTLNIYLPSSALLVHLCARVCWRRRPWLGRAIRVHGRRGCRVVRARLHSRARLGAFRPRCRCEYREQLRQVNRRSSHPVPAALRAHARRHRAAHQGGAGQPSVRSAHPPCSKSASAPPSCASHSQTARSAPRPRLLKWGGGGGGGGGRRSGWQLAHRPPPQHTGAALHGPHTRTRTCTHLTPHHPSSPTHLTHPPTHPPSPTRRLEAQQLCEGLLVGRVLQQAQLEVAPKALPKGGVLLF